MTYLQTVMFILQRNTSSKLAKHSLGNAGLVFQNTRLVATKSIFAVTTRLHFFMQDNRRSGRAVNSCPLNHEFVAHRSCTATERTSVEPTSSRPQSKRLAAYTSIVLHKNQFVYSVYNLKIS